MKKYNLAFFGTSAYSVMVLEKMKRAGLAPSFIITTPDKPQGRNLIVTPPPVKVWAQENKIPFVQPEKLNEQIFIDLLKEKNFDLFVIVAYGKIIPQAIIDIPTHGALNIHASLLPKFRGASPIESAILADDREAGVTIIQIDAKMDHGPIVAQAKVNMPDWPPTAAELGAALVEAGAELLVKIIPEHMAGKTKLTVQDETQATYTKKIEKTDGLINLADDPYQNFLKIQAFAKWPTAYFFPTSHNNASKDKRVIIKKAKFTDGKLEILRVVPEGKREMNYSEFLRN